jgi:fucose 4-O-acetylase-like acetyltransferase
MLDFIKQYMRATFTPPQFQSNQLTNSKVRIQFIDLAKGVCILLVVLTHSGAFSNYMPQELNLLRMPLYFILSGLFYKDYGGVIATIVKKMNKLLIPFIFFYVMSYAILGVGNCISQTVGENTHHFTDIFYGLYFFNNPIWFLLCLFNINIIFTLLRVVSTNEIFLALASIVCGAIGYVLSINNLDIYYFVDVALTAMPMFYFGHLLSRTKLLYPSRLDRWAILGGALMIALVVFVSRNIIPGVCSILYYENLLGYNFLAIDVFSIIAVVGLLLILKPIKWLPVVSVIGRYSIVVLCIHFVIIRFMEVLAPTISHEEILLICIVLCWALIPLFVKFLPWFTAQKDLITLPRKK